MTTKVNEVPNRAWLLANDLSLEFDLWCTVNDCEPDDVSLQFSKNEKDKADQLKKMVIPFSNVDGFFVCWNSEAGICPVFNQVHRYAAELFADLKSKQDAELYSWKSGVLKRIA